jgi:hypothetical protein
MHITKHRPATPGLIASFHFATIHKMFSLTDCDPITADIKRHAFLSTANKLIELGFNIRFTVIKTTAKNILAAVF